MPISRRAWLAAATMLAPGKTALAQAEAYPVRPLRMLIRLISMKRITGS